MDPNDAEPEIKTATKHKVIEVVTPEPEEPKKKPKIEAREPKHERRRSETKVEVDGHIETHTTLSPKTPPGDPPEPEELVKVSGFCYYKFLSHTLDFPGNKKEYL